ncbi:unnamed protein product [Adineta ricciae]|uniref:Uncharacterized protein n=1 Tax=Adineta ricciae TaxID=249248 RepID=A0A816BCR9_ADIRI|nr:unnamed protein product [Adineta ricciae]CAF1608759.1 unnamed protein product [Adineta ricciae]
MANQIISDDENIIERFTKIFQSKHKSDNGENTMSEEDLDMMAGRVSQGSNEVDFEYLQKRKKFAWVMGGDGLNLFLKQSNIQALRSIGFEDRWIRRKLEAGRRFRLGIFYRSDQRVLATWDGILSLIDQHFPKPISTKICQHADAFKSMTFDEIETRARSTYLKGASYFDVDQMCGNGIATEPRLMTEERFLACEGTLEESRGFLYNRLAAASLFDGSGFTKDSNGQLHVREYLQPSVPVCDLPGFRYLDIPIDNNDLMPND